MHCLNAGLALRSVAAIGLALIPAMAAADQTARLRADIDGHELTVFQYQPRGCAAPSVLMVFHGNGRTAESYLNSAKPLADEACFVIYAPLFDRDRFPNWSYHRGGLVDDGRMRPENEWTVEMADDLVDWVRAQDHGADPPIYLFGHSAGAQFLSRVAAYALPDDVSRIILANPSTYVLPTTDEAAPYGYGGLPGDMTQEWMRDYLAAPITVYLGDEDVGDEDLTMTDAAVRQGINRLDRGQRTFAQAEAIAKQNGWTFNWRLEYADGVGHTARGMLGADDMIEALGF